MVLGIYSREQTTITPKALVPSFLIEVRAFGVHLFKEARVANVQLIGRNPNDWTWQVSC